MEWTEVVAIVVGGIVGGVVNTLVGGGTSIVLPLLLALGVPPQLANGTNRLCVAFQAGAAAVALRGRTGGGGKGTGIPVLAALLGAIPGAFLATILDEELYRGLLGWLLLGGVVLFFAPRRSSPKGGEEPGSDSQGLPRLGLLVTFLFGVYGGFLGAGIGVLIMLYLPSLLRLPLVRMVEIKVWMVFALSAAAGLVYLGAGDVDLSVLLPLLPSYVLGGVLGARLALRGGEKWLRRAIALVAAGLAIGVITGVV